MRKYIKKISFLLWIAIWVAQTALVSSLVGDSVLGLFEHNAEAGLIRVFFGIAMVCLLSFLSFYLAHKNPLPSFVIALIVGIAAKPFLGPLVVEHHEALAIVVTLGATMILFQGGWETPFQNFKKLFWKISLLAFPGVLLTAWLFSLLATGVGSIVGIAVPVTVAVLLGAVLASTDPAAIIPLLQPLRFRTSTAKDIVISESAMNDVVGALLTIVLLGFVKEAGGSFGSISEGFATLFALSSGAVLLKQMLFGVVFGVVGYFFLQFLSKHKEDHDEEYGADAAFLLFVPVIAFTGALMLGGSGYLAAFVAGLLFSAADRLRHTEHFYNQTIDGFAKPVIFLLLGALVDVQSLIAYAPIGLLMAFLFIFVLRPLMVFLMLGAYIKAGKERLSVRELWFISWVRETGAIPAVLLVTVVSFGLPNMEAFVPIGMWVILTTLMVQPALTPFVARRLGLVE